MGKFILSLNIILIFLTQFTFLNNGLSFLLKYLKNPYSILLKLCVQVRKDDSQSHAGVVRLIQLFYCLFILKIL
jgi:hypothetical protein